MIHDLKGPAAVGLDARGNRIYAVCLDTRDVFWPSLLEQRRFASLEAFRDWWDNHDWLSEHLQDPDRTTHEVRVAVDAYAHERLGAFKWLRDKGVPLNEFYPILYDEEVEEQLQTWGLPNAFRRAFALAFFALYRMQGPLVAGGIWSDLQEAESRLRELNVRVERLYQALSYCERTHLPSSVGTARYHF